MNIENFSARKNIGLLSVKPFQIEQDIETLFSWTSQPYAKFWGHLNSSIEQLKEEYQTLCSDGKTKVFLGTLDDAPMFLLELYDPAKEPVGGFYQTKHGDLGMHILIAPADKKVHDFTYEIFTFIMDFMFQDPSIKRIVVEPDSENEKIHRLNKRVGFQHIKKIDLGHKHANLAFCEKDDFYKAMDLNAKLHGQFLHERLHKNPDLVVDNLTPENWSKVNRHLVCKAISEAAHERIILPDELQTPHTYEIVSDDGSVSYFFKAQLMALNHWAIDKASVEKYRDNKSLDLDAVEFILEFHQSLGIPQDKLATYLEEITSTLSSAAYKLNQTTLSAEQLCDASFQQVETAMTEGHPAFIANNGRIGFDAGDFQSYAPEAANEIQLLWVATHESRTHFACSSRYSYEQLLEDEFDLITRQHFDQILIDKGLVPEEYRLIPVHPWQWFNKLSNVYASDIAANNIVCLGYGDDYYLAQQSIRTFFNVSHTKKYYVKTALSILNMGFMRGLSAYYMRTTPVINDWLYSLVTSDDFFEAHQFRVLREIAAVGYSNPYYEDERLADNPYKKMLAGLWRESPVNQISDTQSLMTMASLLHLDSDEQGVLPALIRKSELTVDQWLSQYLHAYLSPLLHCYFKYDLVFMPHGENLIMVMENYVPVGMFMKDIGEEICVLNSDQVLPSGVERIAVNMPEEMEVLSVFTDMFDGFFRYMNHILVTEMALPEGTFWKSVATCIHDYQEQHPEFEQKFHQHDLFAKDFEHSCLNRLQLRNNQKMVDLSDPGGSLKFAGRLNNPIAHFKAQVKHSNKNEEVA